MGLKLESMIGGLVPSEEFLKLQFGYNLKVFHRLIPWLKSLDIRLIESQKNVFFAICDIGVQKKMKQKKYEL